VYFLHLDGRRLSTTDDTITKAEDHRDNESTSVFFWLISFPKGAPTPSTKHQAHHTAIRMSVLSLIP